MQLHRVGQGYTGNDLLRTQAHKVSNARQHAPARGICWRMLEADDVSNYFIHKGRRGVATRAIGELASVRHDGMGDSDTIAAVVSSAVRLCCNFVTVHRLDLAAAVLGATKHARASDSTAGRFAGGQGGSVAIIRISGRASLDIAKQVFRTSSPKREWLPKSHRIYYGHITDISGGVLDEVLALVMLAPRSYTTEDVVEIHCHGGGVSAQRVLDRCLQAGCRLAKNGEFTMRAFLNGRLDLSQAESVMQLVTARTPSAADSALAGLEVRVPPRDLVQFDRFVSCTLRSWFTMQQYTIHTARISCTWLLFTVPDC